MMSDAAASFPHHQWEVILYNPKEKQTVLYNKNNHTLRILEGRGLAGNADRTAAERRHSVSIMHRRADKDEEFESSRYNCYQHPPPNHHTKFPNWHRAAFSLPSSFLRGVAPVRPAELPQHIQRCPLCMQQLPVFMDRPEHVPHRHSKAPPFCYAMLND